LALDALRSGAGLRSVRHGIQRLAGDHVVGYEFLARSSVEPFGLPVDFFRLAFESNVLTLVDHHCFRLALEASRGLAPDLSAHLNVFPSTLIDVPTAHLIESFPTERPAETYCVEISEQQIIGDPSYLVGPVCALRRHGVRIAVDDVGFGRSCLESLVLLEPDVVKIDRRCVQGVARDPDQRRSLERLLKVSDTLDAKVVAEGVESREDKGVLEDLGVELGQGYLWGHPA
ncbi:MAG TPA: EAL domain-containing protein, partial [Planctomycetota bacterium]|nr:EAL domain-containing protein [Planctomycetota bacterium]